MLVYAIIIPIFIEIICYTIFMTPKQFQAFSDFRDDFRKKIKEWSVFNEELSVLQKQAAKEGGIPEYPVQNPVCYNTALDEITEKDNIHLILIGDNPGKNEQLDENKRYLVGLAGKLGTKFFAENPELGTDFRKNVIILNKTPVHSARTENLRWIIKNGRPEIGNLILESQKWMAKSTAELHMRLSEGTDPTVLGTGGAVPSVPQLWLVGYAELKGKGLFLPYRDTLLTSYQTSGEVTLFTQRVFTFQHFSMNRFSIDLNNFKEKEGSVPSETKQTLARLGSLHRKEIFGV